jgi:hypothetical protein
MAGLAIPLIIIISMEAATFWPIVIHAATYGLVLSAVLFPMVLGLTWLNPEIMLNDYPPDIRAKYGPMSAQSKRQRGPAALVVVTALLVIVVFSFRGLPSGAADDIPFLTAAVHRFVLFGVFNLLDWLILDWLIVVTLCPRFIILPGTEGVAGYKDYSFHFRGFLIGTGITAVTSLVVAAEVATLF